MDAINYISLLITTLSLVVLALFLIIALYVPPLVPYRAFTATVLVGSVGLALLCVWDILGLETQRAERTKDDGKRRPHVLGCPNHYVRDDAAQECKGGEVRLEPGADGRQVVLKFTDSVSLQGIAGKAYEEICNAAAVTSPKYAWTDLRGECEAIAGI
jgi:hypothetical protein